VETSLYVHSPGLDAGAGNWSIEVVDGGVANANPPSSCTVTILGDPPEFYPLPHCRDCGTVPCWRHQRRVWPLQDPEPAVPAAANVPSGWRCPQCGACWSPWVQRCGSPACRPLVLPGAP